MASIASNSKLARDIVFRVTLKSTASKHVDAVTEWLATVVGTLYPAPDGEYPCVVVSGTKHDDWVDTEDNDSIHHEIMAVCHRMWGPEHNCLLQNSRMDGLVVAEEFFNEVGDEYLLDPRTIASKLRDDSIVAMPAEVEAVGVSGVSAGYAAMVWKEIITTERNWMDGSGKGYMVHPMFMYDKDNGCHSMREMSCNFNWHNPKPHQYFSH